MTERRNWTKKDVDCDEKEPTIYTTSCVEHGFVRATTMPGNAIMVLTDHVLTGNCRSNEYHIDPEIVIYETDD